MQNGRPRLSLIRLYREIRIARRNWDVSSLSLSTNLASSIVFSPTKKITNYLSLIPKMPLEKPPLLLLKPFLLLVPLTLLLLFFLLHSNPSSGFRSGSGTGTGTTSLIRMRRSFATYDDYLKLQLNKTLDPRLRRLWATRDWDRKVAVFSAFFSRLQTLGLLSNSSRALCIGARLGQEVAALRRVGVAESVGIDLVAAPPLVVEGDFHSQPFADDSFDFEFSNVFDHALFPDRFVHEIERTLRPGGVAVLHVAVHRRGDKYSANDLFGVDGVIGLFKESAAVSVEKVDGFGLDTEIVMRKRKSAV